MSQLTIAVSELPVQSPLTLSLSKGQRAPRHCAQLLKYSVLFTLLLCQCHRMPPPGADAGDAGITYILSAAFIGNGFGPPGPLVGFQLSCVTFNTPSTANNATSDQFGNVQVSFFAPASVGCFVLGP